MTETVPSSSTVACPTCSRTAVTTCRPTSGPRGCCSTTRARSRPCTRRTSGQVPTSRRPRATRRACRGWWRRGSRRTGPRRPSAAASRVAREVRDELAEELGRELLVAASVGPYGAYLADGSEYRGRYGVSAATLARLPRPAARAAGRRRTRPAGGRDHPRRRRGRGAGAAHRGDRAARVVLVRRHRRDDPGRPTAGRGVRRAGRLRPARRRRRQLLGAARRGRGAGDGPAGHREAGCRLPEPRRALGQRRPTRGWARASSTSASSRAGSRPAPP